MLEGEEDEREGRMIVRSDIAANVWKIEVAVGEAVREGAVLAILESMKMEIPVEAPSAGTVLEILIAAVLQRTRLQSSDSRRFRIRGGRTAIRTKADARGNIGSAGTRH